jgi:hypothetical protein
LKVAAVALPKVTVNGVPAVVGVTVDGEIAHVLGAPAVHVSFTLPPYPSTAIKVPFQITF